MAPAVDQLSEDHAAVYDRQLRVWGVEVQRRLMEAKVLIIGLTGLTAEIAKNLVLAGVGTVGLVDDTPATHAAPGNFLVEPEAAAGRSVAEASALTLSAMNPLMAVRTEAGPPHVAPLLAPEGSEQAAKAELTSLLARYDTVVAAGLPLAQLAALNAACRAAPGGHRQLFGGAVRGASAFVFADLGPTHTYSVKGEAGERTATYGTFRDAMSACLAGVNKRTHPLYLALRACWEFEEASGRPAAGPADVAPVRALADKIAAATPAGAASPAAAAALLPPGLLQDFVLDAASAASSTSSQADGDGGAGGADGDGEDARGGGGEGEGGAPLGELAPVCAVVGGVVANNVLRAVSRVGPPLRNLFLYSLGAMDGLGVEECFV